METPNKKPEFSEDAFYALYPYGSRVYGTAHEHSDWDYIAIDQTGRVDEMIRGQINLKIMTPEHFQSMLDEHHVTVLECLYLPASMIEIKPAKPWLFKLSKEKLRHSFMEKVSKDWVKAKKKFVSPYEHAEDEMYRGKKSLYHSFRILSYGIQIAKFGKIVAYDEMNSVYNKIMSNPSTVWTDYEDEWKAYYNSLCSEFRKVAPK